MDSFFKKGVVWQSTTGIFYRIVLVAAMAITLLLFQLNMDRFSRPVKAIMAFMRGVFCKFACKKWLLCKNYHFKSYCWILKYDIIIDLGHQLNLFSLSQTFLKVKYVFKGKKMWQMPGFFFFLQNGKFYKNCCVFLINFAVFYFPQASTYIW